MYQCVSCVMKIFKNLAILYYLIKSANCIDGCCIYPLSPLDGATNQHVERLLHSWPRHFHIKTMTSHRYSYCSTHLPFKPQFHHKSIFSTMISVLLLFWGRDFPSEMVNSSLWDQTKHCYLQFCPDFNRLMYVYVCTCLPCTSLDLGQISYAYRFL